MSYLGGFSRLCFGDEDSQEMAKGEDSVGSREGEGPPSTSFEDVPSRVDAIGVITWLKPVGEPRASWLVLEEVFLSTQCLGLIYVLRISCCSMYG